jgi:hypothetical protein
MTGGFKKGKFQPGDRREYRRDDVKTQGEAVYFTA